MYLKEKASDCLLILLLCGFCLNSMVFSQTDKVIRVYTVKVEKLNLRDGPGTGYNKVASLIKGEQLKEISVSGKWIEVICLNGNNKNKKGFVHKDYITKAYTRNLQKEKKAENDQNIRQDSAVFSSSLYGSDTLVVNDDLSLIKRIQANMRKDALFFLSLLKQMEPRLKDDSLVVETIEKVKVIQSGAVILDHFIPGSRIIHYPYFNESFTVQEELEEYFCVELPQGRKGYIHKRLVQFYTESHKKPVVTFEGVDKNAVAGLLNQLNEIFLSISTNKKIADVLAQKYNLNHSNLQEFVRYYQKINKYYEYAKKFYEEFRLERDFQYFGSRESFLEKMRVWGQLMIGSESRKTQYVADDAQTDKIKGGNQNISFGASYRADDDLEVNVSINKQKEIMLQEFNTFNIGGDVRFLGVQDVDLLFRSRYNTYRSQDNENAEFNNVTVGSNLGYRLSNSLDLVMDYDLNSYSYINDEQNNYSIHSMHGGLNYRTTSELVVNMKVLFESESGDLSSHQFTHLKPYLLLTKRKDRSFIKTRLVFDNYNFKDFTEGNYQKIRGEFNWGNNRSDYIVGGFYKNFPNRENSNYWQARTRLTLNSEDLRRRFVVSLYNNFFTDNEENNYSNLRFVYGTMNSNFNMVLTAWHNPGDADKGETVKSHIADIYAKFDISSIFNAMFGINAKYVHIGPVIGLHANLNSAEFKEKKWFERDGNLYRIGGFVNLNYPVNDKIRITGNGTFENGSVYTTNYTGFNDNTGEIEIDTVDPVFLRHPVTYQMNLRLDYQISMIINLVLRGGFYKVSTDFHEIPGSYPIESNSRFYILGGINFRRN